MTGLLEGVAIAPLSIVINYTLSALFGIGFTYYMLGQLFERRMSGLFWWSYFILKSSGDAILWYAVGNGGAGTWVESLCEMWQSVLAIVSLAVVLISFRGNVASVGACSVISDILAGATTWLSWTIVNVLMGYPPNRGFLVSVLIDVGFHLVLFGVLMVSTIYLVRRPILWLLGWVCRMTMRHRMMWFSATICLIVYLAFVVSWEYLDLVPNYSLATFLPSLILPFVLLWLLLRLSLRDVALRAQVMVNCARLARDYERVVREQLRVLDRDRTALEGHERVLVRLGREGAGPGLSARVRELEETYRRLSAGSYCAQPALDAVLTAGAGRLAGLGINPIITVAAAPAQTAEAAMAALALLNLAGDAASHAEGARGAEVELRVRGIGGRLLLRLEVPSSWGMLSARRLLRPVIDGPSILVREQRRGDRRIVLVLMPAEGEDVGTR